MDKNNFCFPQNKDGTGQFQLNGYTKKGGSEIMISSGTTNGLSATQPPPLPSPTNMAPLAIGGGGVAGAAVIGIVLFNKKKQMKQAPKLENELPEFKTVV